MFTKKMATLTIVLLGMLALMFWDYGEDNNSQSSTRSLNIRRRAQGKGGKGKGGKGGKGKGGKRKGGKGDNDDGVTGTLPEETVDSIDNTLADLEDPFFQEETTVEAAYIGAFATIAFTDLIKSGNATAVELANAEDFKMRTVECMYYLSGGNIQEMSVLIGVSEAAAIITDEDAIAVFNESHLITNNLQLYVRNESEWASSCVEVMTTEDALRTAGDRHMAYTPPAVDLSTPKARKDSPAARRVLQTGDNYEDDCVDVTVDVFHVNGINNHPSDRQASAVALRRLLSGIEDITVSYIPNPTEGQLLDLFEVFNLKKSEYNLLNEAIPDLIDDTDITLAKVGQFLALRALAEISIELPTSVHELFSVPYIAEVTIAWAEKQSERARERNSRVTSQIQSKIQYSIEVGRGVVLVPHSQGCLLSNDAWQGLSTENRAYVSIVATGTPASYVGDSSNPFDYVQRKDDRVVKFIPLVLPGNVDGSDANDLYFWRKNHDFISSYVQDSSVGAAMKSKISLAIDNVGIPSELEFSAGVISATLTWGAQPDLDLHVYEPSGSHVYFANLVGDSGALDLDDTTSYGPENYVVQCSNLAYGSYQIGVHYYYGDGSEVGEVRVYAGGVVREFRVAFSAADVQGTVRIVATVIVTEGTDDEAVPTFEII